MTSFESFSEIWFVDFEFNAMPGNNPNPICMVAKELFSQKLIRLWEDDLQKTKVSPFNQEKSLFVSYYAAAEIGCFLELGWKLPKYVLDLYVEFRNHTNQRIKFCSDSLLGALSFFGINSISNIEKNEMRDLAIRGGPYSTKEKADLIEYCESDVLALEKLFAKFVNYIPLKLSLLRGEYSKYSAVIERNGIPINFEILDSIEKYWDEIKLTLIKKVNERFNVFEGFVFKKSKWEEWLYKNNIPWPKLKTGNLKMDDETFSSMAKTYPEIRAIQQVRHTLSKLRLNDLSVGSDSRNRTMLSVFRSKTGRNQPSNSKFIFGPSVWIRNLIKPQQNTSIAYIDWSQQEFGIAAALSNDANMKKAYLSNDPYFEFAKLAKAVPVDSVKEDFPEIRELYKQCVLAVQYGMGAEALALKINKSVAEAKVLLNIHKTIFSDFWKWSDNILDYSQLHGKIYTTFGWNLHTENIQNSSTIRNFPMQANGAEILRLATILGIERGVKICAPVHDAFLIEASSDKIEEHCETMQNAMKEASAIILNGFELRSDKKVINYPGHYSDQRGDEIWEVVTATLDALIKPKSKDATDVCV